MVSERSIIFALSAALMAVCNVLLWVVFNPGTHPRYLRTLILWTVVIGIGFAVIWFYWQGKNWARIAVLIHSAFCILNLRAWNRPSSSPGLLTTPTQTLGAVLLFWLNTPPVRHFFKGKSQLPA